MIFTETKLKGAYIIDVDKLEDDRGFFGRTFSKNEFELLGLNGNTAQTNIAHNKQKGTIRGMHMQLAPYGETKYVRCTRGAIYDVIVDLRGNSETFKQWISVELSAENFKMIYVPEGFAHGYLVLEDNTDTTYQVSQFYTSSHEIGVRWNDPAINIQWPFEPKLVSEKDRNHPDLSDSSTFYDIP